MLTTRSASVPRSYHDAWQSTAVNGKWKSIGEFRQFLQFVWQKLNTRSLSLVMKAKEIAPPLANLRWLTTNEVCEHLSISYNTWAKWRQRGVAPQAKRLPNGQLRTREDWLAEFMDDLPEAS